MSESEYGFATANSGYETETEMEKGKKTKRKSKRVLGSNTTTAESESKVNFDPQLATIELRKLVTDLSKRGNTFRPFINKDKAILKEILQNLIYIIDDIDVTKRENGKTTTDLGTRLSRVESMLQDAFDRLPGSGKFEDKINQKIQPLLSDVKEEINQKIQTLLSESSLDRELFNNLVTQLENLLEGVALVDFDGGYDEGRARADHMHKVQDLTKVPFKEALNAWHVQ